MTVLTVLAVVGGGTSTRSQAFLAFVVVYAGFHLRPVAAVVATAYSVAAGGLMLLDVAETTRAAVSEWVFFGARLAVIVGLLIPSTSKQNRLVAALERQADVDALTGLVTRRVLDEALARALTQRAGAEGTALLLMDVDEFKSINDVHGPPRRRRRARPPLHDRQAADPLQRRRGQPDGRRGDRDPAAPQTAVRRAQQRLDAVRGEPLTLPDGTLYGLSISVGVAHVERSTGDLRALYAAADDAVYAAKRGGRGRVEVAVA